MSNSPFNGVPRPDNLHDQLAKSLELLRPLEAAKAASPFKKAVKYDAKLRLAISGPAGSGKTYTLLKLASELGGPVAGADTEHGSMSKYADIFNFDVTELSSFDPDIIPELIQQAHTAGYRSLIVDSLSHFWTGVGGELDQVDKITARSKSGNSFTAWREVSPKHNRMVDAILSAPIHILVGMRSKTQWMMVENSKGKMEPKRVGMDSVMRDGIEYEFDVAADMDVEHNFVVSKTRCGSLDGYVCNRPGAQVARILSDWLASPIARPEPPAAPVAPAEDLTPMRAKFAELEAELGHELFMMILGSCGFERVEDIPTRTIGVKIYREMLIAKGGTRQ